MRTGLVVAASVTDTSSTVRPAETSLSILKPRIILDAVGSGCADGPWPPVPSEISTSICGFTILGHRRDWGCDAGRPAAPAIHVRVIGMAGTIDVWRVPHDLHDSSYSDIFHALEDRPRRLPA